MHIIPSYGLDSLSFIPYLPGSLGNKKGETVMKKIKIILVLAVLLSGLGLSAYASDDALSDLSSGALNINTATVEQLRTLPFVDSATAQNIVNYRDSHGPFSSIDELKNVRGITRTFLEDLHTHLILKGDSNYNPYGAL
jgi:competence ComEA-like helix-hairpin-helix protein